MTSAWSRRIHGAFVWMLASAAPPALLVVFPHASTTRHLGLVSGATLGARLADRRFVTNVRAALLLGAVTALLTAALIYAWAFLFPLAALASVWERWVRWRGW